MGQLQAPPVVVSPLSELELRSGLVRLRVGSASGILVQRKDGETLATFACRQPMSLEVLDSKGATRWFEGGYTSVVLQGESLRCSGTIQTPAGSRFEFTDTYTAGAIGNTVRLARLVAVAAAGADDAGFLTRFSLSGAPSLKLQQQELFIPGVWYRDNEHLPASALNADPGGELYLVREDRLPLPLVMLREPRNGATLTLVHASPDGSTSAADHGPGPVVDARIQTASMGVFRQDDAAPGIFYPCVEGGARRNLPREPQVESSRPWARRFHPVRSDVRHAYEVLVDVSVNPDFPSALRHAWRVAYEADCPEIQGTVDLPAIYDASIRLLVKEYVNIGGAAGIPFRLKLPGGELLSANDLNFQMGFVGQQIPLAYHLLRQGLRNKDQEALRDGEAIMNFWAANALTPEGLPRTWFNLRPKPVWRRQNTFLRVACDGMLGAIDAWDVMKAHGSPRTEWLEFCRHFGDWLVKHQNADGSWCREYDWSGAPVNQSPLNTADAIPFLAKLHLATGQREYRDAASRAGEWAYLHVHEEYAYVGGTADNPNVTDKEAGYLALNAFLALHDLDGDPRWLTAAVQAADFTETWAYSWNIPLGGDAGASAYPRGCPTTAFSLIAAGQSGADLFLAGAVFSYYRLYLATGDLHFFTLARRLLYDTRKAVDLDGSLGYGIPGLCTEALTLVAPRGRGVEMWLPWLTYSMIEPLAELQDAYGLMDLPRVGAVPLDELRAKDAAYGARLGLRSVPPGR